MLNAGKNDIHDEGKRLRQTIDRIRRSTVPLRSKEALSAWSSQLLREGLSEGRREKLLSDMFKIAGWMHCDLPSATKEEMERVVGYIQSYGYAEWTKHDYLACLKKFYKWLRGTDHTPPEVAWIKTPKPALNHSLPSEILTESEIKAMIDAAYHPRDKALIASLYESGCRVGELCSLRLRNVSFDKYGAQIIVDGKTGRRRVRLISSVPYLSTWINNHPDGGKPDAWLWVGIGKVGRNKPLDYPSVRKMLRSVAQRAGIKKRVNPHAFRHARATYLASHLTESQLNEMFGWVQGSRIPQVYVHMSGRNVDDALLKLHGMKREEKEEEVSPLKVRKCPRCGYLSPEKFCNRCGAVLDLKAAISLQTEMERVDKELSSLLEDPEVKTLLMKKIEERLSRS